MIKTKLSGIFLATTLLAGIMLIGFSIGEAEAKKSREIVVVGSKVKDVVRSAKIMSCDFTLRDADGTTTREDLGVPAKNPGGVVKLPNVPDEVLTVDVQCEFENTRSGIPMNGVELKEIGTTVIHYCDCVDPDT
jgi:hypothetical protein